MPTETANTLKIFNFDNSYVKLPPALYEKVLPAQVPAPQLVVFNDTLAETLGLEYSHLDKQLLAQVLSGNQLPLGAEPIAQAYAGHQFGHFTMLGDGRAILLGEHITPDKQRFDIQLKGAGQTPFSRRGDGKATLKAALREYLISEAMAALGIPTSRSLAVVATGETVYRETTQPGAVLTRIMQSHIRVGTFEYVRHFHPKELLANMVNYTIQRHFPQLADADNTGMALLRKVMQVQIHLIVHWMRVGFIHGVMNTDNMAITGESFDYGPCAFMNTYHPDTVFSSIDTGGRYAYSNQPRIGLWNLACLAGALLPVIHTNEHEAVEMVKTVLDDFQPTYEQAWLHMMGKKLGIPNIATADKPLVMRLLNLMQQFELDYTLTFLHLAGDYTYEHKAFQTETFQAWRTYWQQIRDHYQIAWTESKTIMQSHNPYVIPRNHVVESVLDTATLHNNFEPLNKLLQDLKSPYEAKTNREYLQIVPAGIDVGYKTYCGT